MTPPTAVSIFLAVAIQQNSMNQEQGNAAVVLSGCALLLVGIFKPVTEFVTKLIPDCIQASPAVGIGLITALAGAIELDLVVPGKYTIVQMGPLTPAIVISIIGTIIIALSMHFHFRGAFVSGLLFGTIAWWWYEDKWPAEFSSTPNLTLDLHLQIDYKVIILFFNLLFLYVLTLNGIARSMSDLAGLTNVDCSIPRGNWLFIMCGIATILSGYLSGPPILISPETAGGIKAGGKTGLSSLVCGILFSLSVFFCPTFSEVPPAGTSPLLVLVGMMLFMNTSRIKWNHIPEAVPAFFVLLLIPFTYSILCGVGFGYIFYICIGVFSGDLLQKARQLLSRLRNFSYESISSHRESRMDLEDHEYIDEMRCNEELYSTEVLGHNEANQSSFTRVRAGSIVDRLSMDLSSGIKSMQA